jgi:hypothetical protein
MACYILAEIVLHDAAPYREHVAKAAAIVTRR